MFYVVHGRLLSLSYEGSEVLWVENRSVHSLQTGSIWLDLYSYIDK